MALKQTIAIIGADEIVGSAIAKSLSKSDYRLILVSKDHKESDILKSNLLNGGAKAEIETDSCAKEASWEADIILMATPYEAEKEVIEKIKDVAVAKVVISISTPSTRNYKNQAQSPETSAAEELQKLLPYSKVVKTFNTVFARNYITSMISSKNGETFIAGNNSDALEAVSKLVLSAGFIPIVVGDLSVSRRLETLHFSF